MNSAHTWRAYTGIPGTSGTQYKYTWYVALRCKKKRKRPFTYEIDFREPRLCKLRLIL